MSKARLREDGREAAWGGLEVPCRGVDYLHDEKYAAWDRGEKRRRGRSVWTFWAVADSELRQLIRLS